MNSWYVYASMLKFRDEAYIMECTLRSPTMTADLWIELFDKGLKWCCGKVRSERICCRLCNGWFVVHKTFVFEVDKLPHRTYHRGVSSLSWPYGLPHSRLGIIQVNLILLSLFARLVSHPYVIWMLLLMLIVCKVNIFSLYLQIHSVIIEFENSFSTHANYEFVKNIVFSRNSPSLPENGLYCWIIVCYLQGEFVSTLPELSLRSPWIELKD